MPRGSTWRRDTGPMGEDMRPGGAGIYARITNNFLHDMATGTWPPSRRGRPGGARSQATRAHRQARRIHRHLRRRHLVGMGPRPLRIGYVTNPMRSPVERSFALFHSDKDVRNNQDDVQSAHAASRAHWRDTRPGASGTPNLTACPRSGTGCQSTAGRSLGALRVPAGDPGSGE